MIARHPDYAATLAAFGDAAPRLDTIIRDAQFCGVISHHQAAELAAQRGQMVDELALSLLPFAALYSVAPVSHYNVGAVVLGGSGALYWGANLEIAGEALCFTLHAEQSAVGNAWMNGETGVSSIAISAAPCGYCRQFLFELAGADALMVSLPGAPAAPLAHYLPDAFGPADLGKPGGLMQPTANDVSLAIAHSPVVEAAIAAANMAYSPYTGTFAGVALQCDSGRVVSGAYAENAAFNPSLSPMILALSQLALSGEPLDRIAAAALVEPASALASQYGAARTVLAALSDVSLQHLVA